jgi:non-specific serine/threonine protein kinase
VGGPGTGFPAETTSFVGRRQELADAKRQLSVARLLTLTGPGGVGKTRLAARLTQQITKAFPDGVYVVSMAALRDGALVPPAVADELGIRDEAGRPPMELLLEHLSGRRSLLVIDNCEHLLDACASLISELLAKTERVRVLATSRHRIGLIEEYLLSVPPLAAPPAARLFADRAAAVRPGFEISDDNREAVARLCRRLDGLPLAIELAAVRMQALRAGQLDERMEQRYRLLTSGSPVAPPRHQTLRAAVDWSYDLGTEQEKLA